MPTYSYNCTKCNHEFEEILRVKDIDKPLKIPCIECGSKDIKRIIALGSICDSVRIMGNKKKLDSRFVDRMKDIQRKNPGNSIKERWN